MEALEAQEYKVAISQPMHGKTYVQIAEERASLEAKLTDMGFYVIDTVLTIDDDEDYNPMRYLGRAITLMADADIFVFMPGWESARGCVIEYEIAKAYNKIITILPEDYL